MKIVLRWLCLLGVLAGFLLAAHFFYGVIAMSHPVVDQSDGYVGRTPEAIAATLSQSLPESASQIRYASVSAGMAGRLLIYRFKAPVADLHLHAQKEFDAHWDQPGCSTTPDTPSPFRLEDVHRYSNSYGVDATWMLSNESSVGTVYEPIAGPSSHQPLIFVDEVNGSLFFLMSD